MSTIAGYVVADNHQPLGRVKVLVNAKLVATTQDDGSFSFQVRRPGRRLPTTFAADGYVSNTRIFDPKASAIRPVIMRPIAYRVRFDSSRDLDIHLGGSRLQIPANTVIAPRLARKSKTLELNFTWFDVTSATQRAAAPGDFLGRLRDGSVQRLKSYGIFDFNIKDANGRPAVVREGAKILLAVQLPPRLALAAPRQVGHFSFHAPTGIWVYADDFALDKAVLTYNGSIVQSGAAHNLDNPQEVVCVTVQVVNMSNGTPVPNMYVSAHGLEYDAYGTTNADGFTCLLVERNASFWAEACGQTGNKFWSTPSGYEPTLTSPDFSSGAADCGNPTLCPFVGTVPVSYTLGIGGIHDRLPPVSSTRVRKPA